MADTEKDQEKKLVSKLAFGTTCLKLSKKFLVDPWSIEESSLSNNLLLTVCYKSVIDADA